MRNTRRVRAFLAAGIALVLTAAPMGVYAQETEVFAGAEEIVEEFPVTMGTGAQEAALSIEFGEALYQMTAQGGSDLSWLKDAFADLTIVPGEGSLDGELVIGINDTELYHLLAGYEPESGMVYFSAPELFDEAIAVNPAELVSGMFSSAAGEKKEADGMAGMILNMVLETGMKIAGQVGEFIASLPEDVWQQEMANYLFPVMASLEQKNETGILTIGDTSVEVQNQVVSVPSEKMGDLISNLLTSLSQDQVIEGFLKSGAFDSVFSMVSLLSGGSVDVSGEDLLNQFRAALESAAASDFTGVPGIAVISQNSEDGKASGMILALEAGGSQHELLTCKAIVDGAENCFEIIPGEVLLSASGTATAGSVDILGQGSTEGNVLNETVEVIADGKTAAALYIEDLDLQAMQTGDVIGAVRIEIEGETVEVIYDVEEDGTRTVSELVNGELFFSMAYLIGEAEDAAIDQVDREGARRITGIDDMVSWIGTFKTAEAIGLLEQAGAPLPQENAETEYAE